MLTSIPSQLISFSYLAPLSSACSHIPMRLPVLPAVLNKTKFGFCSIPSAPKTVSFNSLTQRYLSNMPSSSKKWMNFRNYMSRAATSLDREVFNENQTQLVYREVELITRLTTVLETLDVPASDLNELKISIDQLKDLFLLVVIGEFNSGKSSFLNAMLGHKYLEEGVTPTTAQVNILRNGPEFRVAQIHSKVRGLAQQDEHREIQLPVSWLKQISLVDTPGTNAVVEGHQEITEHFVPRSDMVLFVTSCDRAFTESERAFLQKVKQYNKKVVLILSKIDTLDNPGQDLKQIVEFVSDQTKKYFGFVPQIFPVSSKLALKAKIAADAQLDGNPNAPKKSTEEHTEERLKILEGMEKWRESNFGPLESFILSTLNATERGKLKMENPLGIAEHHVKKYMAEHESRNKLVKDDLQTLARIENEMEAFKAEMMTEYSYHEDRIDTVLYAMSERARNFLEQEVTFTNIIKLLNGEKLKSEFEQKVVADTASDIDQYINDMIDWMLKKQASHWQRVVEFAVARQQASSIAASNNPSSMGFIKSQFSYNRPLLLNSLGDNAKKVVSTFDKRQAAEGLASEVKSAVYSTAAVEIGAVGLTFLSLSYLDLQASWITISLLDFTGLLGVGVLAAAGTVFIPYKKRSINNELSQKIADIRLNLKKTLRKHFEFELQKGISDLKDNVAPYSHLVHAEKTKLESTEKQLMEIQNGLITLRTDLETAFQSL